MKIRIISFNIHKGLSYFNHKLTISDIKKVIIEADPDIVFLQEVTGENLKFEKKFDGWPSEKTYEYLADTIWSYFSYAKNAVYPHGHHGNLILSKFPILDWDNLDISTNRLESRGLLSARILIPKDNEDIILSTYCTHLNLGQKGRTKQFDMIKQKLKGDNLANDRIILAGDFNDWNVKAVKYFKNNLHMEEAYKFIEGKYPKTFPSIFPLLSLDRIFFKNLKIKTCDILKSDLAKKMSDHLGLVAEFQI